jgi:hypothetical protein
MKAMYDRPSLLAPGGAVKEVELVKNDRPNSSQEIGPRQLQRVQGFRRTQQHESTIGGIESVAIAGIPFDRVLAGVAEVLKKPAHHIVH